ncbi:MAG: exonuclease SbcCD subunit D [Clostridia bacterium]
MRLLHLSDLHLGKRVNEFSMLEDQRHILRQILAICDQRKPDAVLIAGDIYDRGVPSAEAMMLLDDFLAGLVARGINAMIISGNHDSAERLSYGGRIFFKNNIHIAWQIQDSVKPITLADDYGDVDFYLLPFLRPAEVRNEFPDNEISSYEDGVRTVISHMPINKARRNILIAHQFFTALGNDPLRSDSETVSVGGLDNVNTSLLDGFDYVALGHLHAPQRVGREGIRYGGSPLKYSFSEALQVKGVTWVELGKSGSLTVELLSLTPLHDMREIKGNIATLTDPLIYGNANTTDYIRAILTDEDEIVDAIGKLRAVYPNIMRLDYDNARTRATAGQGTMDIGEQKSALELFYDFYAQQNGAPLTEDKAQIVAHLLEQTEGMSL